MSSEWQHAIRYNSYSHFMAEIVAFQKLTRDKWREIQKNYAIYVETPSIHIHMSYTISFDNFDVCQIDLLIIAIVINILGDVKLIFFIFHKIHWLRAFGRDNSNRKMNYNSALNYFGVILFIAIYSVSFPICNFDRNVIASNL